MRPPFIALAAVLFACHGRPVGSVPPPAQPAAAPTATPAPKPNLTIRDDTEKFLAFWQKAKGESDDARLRRYEAEVVPTFPPYWDYVTQSWGAETNAKIAKQLTELEALEPAFVAVAKRLPSDLSAAISAMRKAFPDFDPLVEIRLFHSLGRMDGGTRVLGGRYYLLFGVDVIARLHDWPDDRPFIVHELFHAYTDQKHGRDGRNPHPVESIEEERTARAQPLYAALWEEGLATYVSEWLNPGASHASLALDLPKGLEATCLANLAFLVDDLLAKLDSTSVADYGDYFLFRSKDPRRPKRAGYCVGYLAAKKLHRQLPMETLVALEGDALRERLREVLPTLVEDPRAL